MSSRLWASDACGVLTERNGGISGESTGSGVQNERLSTREVSGGVIGELYAHRPEEQPNEAEKA